MEGEVMSVWRIARWSLPALVASVGDAFAQSTRPWMSPDEAYPMMMHGLGAMGCFVFGLVVIVAIAAILFGFWRGSARRDDAQSILRARFARGEIDREEYFQRKADLEGDRS
jgi:uncharacterized membrane protein